MRSSSTVQEKLASTFPLYNAEAGHEPKPPSPGTGLNRTQQQSQGFLVGKASPKGCETDLAAEV
jgi:hypothetical protein